MKKREMISNKIRTLKKVLNEGTFFVSIREKIRFKLYLPLQKLWCQLLDRYYGIDTEQVVELGELGLSEVIGERYEATPPREFLKVMGSLKIQPTDVFLDMGSGKGRTMILAGRYPFNRILGLEVSAELNKIAQSNIQHTTYIQKILSKRRCQNYSVFTADASKFKIPDDVTHVYFFNPFPPVIMRNVFENLKASILRTPRDVKIIYYNPKHHKEIEQDYKLIKLKEFRFRHFGLYDSRCNIYQMFHSEAGWRLG